MLDILLMTLMTGLLGYAFVDWIDGEDAPDADDDAPDLTPEPETDPAPLTATVTETEGGVAIEVPEGQPGSLIAVKTLDGRYTDGNDGEGGGTTDYGLTFYLMPEGESFPVDPGGAGFHAEGTTTPEDLEAALGLVEVVGFDLGSIVQGRLDNPDGPTREDSRVEAPEVEANVGYDIYRLNVFAGEVTGTEEEETLSPFEDAGVFYDNVEQILVAGDFTGGTGTDFVLHDSGAAAVLDGRGGDDYLISQVAGDTLVGGAGDDRLAGQAASGEIRGGPGNDDITANGSYDAWGGDGNDGFTAILGGTGAAQLSGGDGDDGFFAATTGEDAVIAVQGDAGNDGFTLSGPGVRAEGGAGADVFNAGNRATALGGEGDDRFQLQSGAVAEGGAGDDVFELWSFHGEATVTATGGSGADVYDVSLRNVQAGDPPEVLRITDFDPAEDVLQVGAPFGQGIGITDIVTREDAGGFTEVEVIFANTDPGLGYLDGMATVTIRLDGVTGFDAAQVVQVA